MTLQVIETRYGGYHFRSRLEARWAVFFDALKVPYRYEAEGFDLGGVRYLPDFFLPEQDCFVEVKGVKPTDEESDKAQRLANASDKRVFVFFGDCWYDSTKGRGALLFFPDEGESYSDQCWCECSKCGVVGIERYGFAEMLEHRPRCPLFEGDYKSFKRHNADSPRLVAAYVAARSARFEFGR